MTSEIPLLHISVISYNRAHRLKDTLASLAALPEDFVAISVFDNGSNDATPDVCLDFLARRPSAKYCRHPFNIGLSANYLNALAHSQGAYTWILGDDDDLDFKAVQSYLDAMADGQHDIIFVCHDPFKILPKPYSGGARSLNAAVQKSLIRNFSFLSGWIFRTNLLLSVDFQQGYRHAIYAFPHIPLCWRLIGEDVNVAVIAEPLIIYNASENIHRPTSPFQFICLWIGACRAIEERSERLRAIEDYDSVSWMAYAIAWAKLQHEKDVAKRLFSLLPELRPTTLLACPLLLLIAFLPPFVFRMVLDAKWLIRGGRRPYTIPEASKNLDRL